MGLVGMEQEIPWLLLQRSTAKRFRGTELAGESIKPRSGALLIV